MSTLLLRGPGGRCPITPPWFPLRDQVAVVNHHLLAADVRLDGARVPPGQLGYIRIFHLDRPECRPEGATHGRWYSRFQDYPGAVRGRVQVDREPVVELDISGCQMTALCHAAGIDAPADPYAIPGLERAHAKKLLLIMLCAESREQGAVAWRKYMEEVSPGADWAQAMEAAESALPQQILGRLWSSAGRYTMTVDARVAGRVLVASARDAVRCIAIHDGFLVPVSQERWLYHAICAAWAAEFPGRHPRLKRTASDGSSRYVSAAEYGSAPTPRRRLGGRE